MGDFLWFVLLVILIFCLVTRISRRKEAERRRREDIERQRIKQCGEVVLSFANHLGYIARQVISREEINELIDSGITPDDLAREIGTRVGESEGLVLGYHAFADIHVDVKLTQEYRARHVYVIGKSGSGKTNLFRNMILQDLEEGSGLAVLAPEQEMLMEEILPYIPEERLDDVMYFDPSDANCTVAFNPLQLDAGEDIDIKVDENLTIFMRVVGDLGPRMEEILRQALYVLIDRPGSTLLDIEPLLSREDASFRNEVLRTTKHEAAASWWQHTYPSFPKDAHLPITNRLGRFLHPRSIRNVLCSPGASLDFRKAMDSGKVLLFNLSDGLLGEQTSQLLGQMIVSKFQLAVMSRARERKAHRRNFYLYLDEFQTFTGTAAVSYEKMLSRARKYKLGLVLAHQQTGQIPTSLLKEILGNVSTIVCFLLSREDALKFSKELVTMYDGEAIHVPEEEILQLRVGEAFCKMGQHAFRMSTYLADQEPDFRRAAYIIERSRERYHVSNAGVAANNRQPVPAIRPEQVLDDIDPSEVFGA